MCAGRQKKYYQSVYVFARPKINSNTDLPSNEILFLQKKNQQNGFFLFGYLLLTCCPFFMAIQGIGSYLTERWLGKLSKSRKREKQLKSLLFLSFPETSQNSIIDNFN